jgi:hypothetical protein
VQSVIVVVGTCSSGTANTVVATRNPNTLASTVGYGPSVDLAAMIIAAGGTVLFIKAATGSAGVASAVTAFATGTSVVTVTGAPFDAYLVKVKVANGGTIGTTGIRLQISLDAGRTYGPEISIGTATTYAITGTNLTLAFAAGTMVTGESVTFGCTEPLPATAGIQSALVALAASPYAVTGWGGMAIQGVWSGANATTLAGYLTTLANGDNFTRAMIASRDAALPTAYGGAGETEATWSAAIALDYSAVSASRICATGGYYNMTSQYPVAAAGAPVLRRPALFALACRQAAIPAQRLASRVRDGALPQIVVDPTNDPTDGFIYHDEEVNPSLDVARFTTCRTRKGRPGFFISNPFLMSATGSVFNLLPKGIVMDIGCTLLNQLGTEEINDDVPLNTNGTIDEGAAQQIETRIRNAMNEAMLNTGMLSAPGVVVTVDRTNNVRTTSIVNIAASLYGRGYILQINATIGLAS